ncbi:hypothetical protein BG011_004881 [Mortierella polycephala]|uniref:Galactose oxidase n=1 Tax=Mortierella polycephala TaxID=41804 RepID=A0A9P6U125_9FUNG|nr:hypothetical protein BG011_004881 [Mortierella polycephala]
MIDYQRHTRSLALFSSLILFFLSIPGHAQDTVVPVSGAAYARHDTKLYILGGGFSREEKVHADFNTRQEFTPNVEGQFMVLDLSIPWEASAPSFKRLVSGPKGIKYTNFPAAISADGQKLVAFHSGNASFASIYNTNTDTWSQSKATVPEPNRSGIFGVADPRTDVVYFSGGYELVTLTDVSVYQFENDSMNKFVMPANRMINTLNYRGVWWPQKQSILYFGGSVMPRGDMASASITQFTPDTNVWVDLQTTGTGPSSRADGCMAMSEDGSKLVVFGGRARGDYGTTFFSELLILDMETLKWSKGASYSSPRVNSVCTIVNSTFISWGGQNEVETVNAPAIIYDIKTNRYTTKFMSSNPETDPTTKWSGSGSGSSSGSDSGSGSGKPLNVPAIIGGVCGGLAFILIMTICYRRSQRNIRKYVYETQAAQNIVRPSPLQSHQPNQQKNAVQVGAAVGSNSSGPRIVAVSQRPYSAAVTPTTVSPQRSPAGIVQPSSQQVGGYQPYPVLYPMLSQPQQAQSPQQHHLQPHLQQQQYQSVPPPAYTDSSLTVVSRGPEILIVSPRAPEAVIVSRGPELVPDSYVGFERQLSVVRSPEGSGQ